MSVELYKVWMSLIDERTTITCLDAHGQVVKRDELFTTMSGALRGPPAHYGCRSMVDIADWRRRDLSVRDYTHSGARYQRTLKKEARSAIKSRRKELGRERFQKAVARARRAKVPPHVEVNLTVRAPGPRTVRELLSTDRGELTFPKPPTYGEIQTQIQQGAEKYTEARLKELVDEYTTRTGSPPDERVMRSLRMQAPHTSTGYWTAPEGTVVEIPEGLPISLRTATEAPKPTGATIPEDALFRRADGTNSWSSESAWSELSAEEARVAREAAQLADEMLLEADERVQKLYGKADELLEEFRWKTTVYREGEPDHLLAGVYDHHERVVQVGLRGIDGTIRPVDDIAGTLLHELAHVVDYTVTDRAIGSACYKGKLTSLMEIDVANIPGTKYLWYGKTLPTEAWAELSRFELIGTWGKGGGLDLNPVQFGVRHKKLHEFWETLLDSLEKDYLS